MERREERVLVAGELPKEDGFLGEHDDDDADVQQQATSPCLQAYTNSISPDRLHFCESDPIVSNGADALSISTCASFSRDATT